jgi:hypothetical protein
MKITPHWGWFFLGPIILMVGVIAASVMIAVGALSAGEGLERIPAPGSGVVRFEEAGTHTVFWEQRGVMQAQVPAGLAVVITPAAGGEPLSQSSGGMNFTYNNNNVAGRNFTTVEVPSPGEYKVDVTVPEGAAGAGQVALGGNPAGRVLGTILGSMAVGGISFVLCLVILIVVAVRRSKSAKAQMAQQYAQYPHPVGN